MTFERRSNDFRKTFERRSNDVRMTFECRSIGRRSIRHRSNDVRTCFIAEAQSFGIVVTAPRSSFLLHYISPQLRFRAVLRPSWIVFGSFPDRFWTVLDHFRTVPHHFRIIFFRFFGAAAPQRRHRGAADRTAARRRCGTAAAAQARPELRETSRSADKPPMRTAMIMTVLPWRRLRRGA